MSWRASAVLLLFAMLGALATFWARETFGSPATGELLKYAGALLSLGVIAGKWINTGFERSAELAEFDLHTRDRYAHGMKMLKNSFIRRAVAGGLAAIIAGACGLVLVHSDTLSSGTEASLSLIGGGSLAIAGYCTAGALRAAMLPAEALSNLRRTLDQERINRERLAAYRSSSISAPPSR